MHQALVLSAALKPGSKTLSAAKAVREKLSKCNWSVDLVDLAAESLPICDGASCYQDAQVKAMTERVKAARLLVLCFPVYNYQPNAATKNFIEITNDGWKDKVVGLIANAGGDKSYLAPMPLAASLMYDHRCLIVPRFLYLSPSCYGEAGEIKLEGLTKELFDQQIASSMELAEFWSTNRLSLKKAESLY
jgi:NAD(P)H-dependent FMN reductase